MGQEEQTKHVVKDLVFLVVFYCSLSVAAPLLRPRSAVSTAKCGRACEASLYMFSGTLNWLNAILSLLQTLDRYRTPSAMRLGGPISLYLASVHKYRRSQPPRSKPLGRLNRAIGAL